MPAFGLGADGSREVDFGNAVAIVTADAKEVSLRWRVGVRDSATAPKAVRAERPDELAALRAEVREANRAHATVRGRLDELLATGRTIPFAQWRANYAEAPLVAAATAGLVWQAAGGPMGLPVRDGDRWQLHGVVKAVDVPADAELHLMHPVALAAVDLAAWQDLVVDRRVVQPVRQIFRETYRPDDAAATEMSPASGELLRFLPFRARLRERGWTVPLLGTWSDGLEVEAVATSGRFTARLVIAAEPGDPADPDVEFASLGALRFDDAGATVRLGEVPPLVFSEIVRDVDLTAAEASIAAEPTWSDHDDKRLRDAWFAATFGPLNESGRVRRAMVRRLLDDGLLGGAELDGDFVRVGTARVHVGTGAALGPGDELLDLGRERAAVPAQYLPFEDDGGLLETIVTRVRTLAATKD